MRSTSVALAAGSAAGPAQSTARLPGASGHSCGASDWRRARVGDRRQFFVVDGDEFGGVLRQERALRDHQRHRLADMHDAVLRQRRPVRDDKLAAILARQRRMPGNIADACHVGCGQDGDDARRAGRRRCVDAFDAGEGVRRAHEDAIGLVRQRVVGGVAAAAADQRFVLDAAVRGVFVAVRVGVSGGVHAGFREGLRAGAFGGPL